MGGAQGEAQDGDDGSAVRVEDGSADRRAAQSEGVAAVRAEGQFQGAVDAVGAAAAGVRDGGAAQDAGLAQAVGGDGHIRTGVDPGPYADRERADAEGVGSAGGQQGEVVLGEGVMSAASTRWLRPWVPWSTRWGRPSTASWLVTIVPRSSATKPVPRGRPAGSHSRTSVARSPHPMIRR